MFNFKKCSLGIWQNSINHWIMSLPKTFIIQICLHEIKMTWIATFDQLLSWMWHIVGKRTFSTITPMVISCGIKSLLLPWNLIDQQQTMIRSSWKAAASSLFVLIYGSAAFNQLASLSKQQWMLINLNNPRGRLVQYIKSLPCRRQNIPIKKK